MPRVIEPTILGNSTSGFLKELATKVEAAGGILVVDDLLQTAFHRALRYECVINGIEFKTAQALVADTAFSLFIEQPLTVAAQPIQGLEQQGTTAINLLDEIPTPTKRLPTWTLQMVRRVVGTVEVPCKLENFPEITGLTIVTNSSLRLAKFLEADVALPDSIKPKPMSWFDRIHPQRFQVFAPTTTPPAPFIPYVTVGNCVIITMPLLNYVNNTPYHEKAVHSQFWCVLLADILNTIFDKHKSYANKSPELLERAFNALQGRSTRQRTVEEIVEEDKTATLKAVDNAAEIREAAKAELAYRKVLLERMAAIVEAPEEPIRSRLIKLFNEGLITGATIYPKGAPHGNHGRHLYLELAAQRFKLGIKEVLKYDYKRTDNFNNDIPKDMRPIITGATYEMPAAIIDIDLDVEKISQALRIRSLDGTIYKHPHITGVGRGEDSPPCWGYGPDITKEVNEFLKRAWVLDIAAFVEFIREFLITSNTAGNYKHITEYAKFISWEGLIEDPTTNEMQDEDTNGNEDDNDGDPNDD